MAKTFKSLSDYADWSTNSKQEKANKPIDSVKEPEKKPDHQKIEKGQTSQLPFYYNIQIHLPETRDPAVYDAIFESIKKHLME